MTATTPTARERLLQQIALSCGQTLRDQRVVDVVAAAERAAAAVGCALDDVVIDDAFVSALVDDIVVPETYFFRQPVHFDHLATALRRTRRRPIRLWSAGCASGEEPWSLAMLLDEHGWLDGAQILATDLSPALLEKGRAGRYRGWSLRGDSGRRATPWLQQDGADLVVADRLRAAVRFEVLNLAHDPFPAGVFDAVFCRNVLLYLNRDVVDRCARGFFAVVKDGGGVYTAAADPPLSAAPFRMIATLGVCWEKNGDEGRAHPTGPTARPAPPAPRRRRHTATTTPTTTPTTAPTTTPRATPTATRPEAPPQPRSLVVAPEDPLAAARRHADAGHVDDALAAVDVVLARDPLSVAARHLRCLLLLARADPPAALVEGRRLLYVAPHLVVGHLLMHRIHLALGDSSAARRAAAIALREALRLPPGPLPLGDDLSVDDAIAGCRALLGER